jgi:hypothetical protein
MPPYRTRPSNEEPIIMSIDLSEMDLFYPSIKIYVQKCKILVIYGFHELGYVSRLTQLYRKTQV